MPGRPHARAQVGGGGHYRPQIQALQATIDRVRAECDAIEAEADSADVRAAVARIRAALEQQP
ncbi:hypothetical protein AB0F42_24360 [Streptomyces buecherae]|uniref:hypothetical protein n=1 Tax=Streptomyces buecherae TaxID=2763006 RepID=UPI0033CC0F0D